MKILMLTDSFLPHAGGSREYYNNIYRNLVDLGDSEVTILTKKIPGWKEFDKIASTQFFRIRRRYKPLASLKYQELPKGFGPFLDAAWHALHYSPDIVHAGDLYPPGVTAMILKKLLGLPYVVYCHGEEITQTDHFRYQPRVRNRIYKYADAVVANSDFARQNLLRIGVAEERIHKITPGVDFTRFRPMPPRTDLLKRYRLEGKIVLLTVARLVPRKGHRVALQAFEKVSREVPDAHYLIVGRGPEEGRLRQFVQDADLSDRVTFAGFIPGTELPDIYNLCDIMLMPNRQAEDGDVEGFGIVFLEANAVGKPVIGGRTGGAAEAIADGSTGFLVNPDDPDEIAGRLRQLLLDPGLRERLGAAGVRRVRSDFSWETRARILRSVNFEILKRNGRKLECKTRVSNTGENSTGSEVLQWRTENGSVKEINDKKGDLVSLKRDGEHALVPIERDERS
jgi:phosphatidylinositol alpha-1,6-mannosyltransferase